MMRFVVVALALLAVVSIRAEGDVDESDVVVGTAATWKDILKSKSLLLVEFYAPWCGHCKRLTPEYAKAATELKGEDVALVKVDATIESELAQRYGVQGYPTLKVFRGGSDQPAEYNGGRTAGDIVKYLKKQMGPAVVPLESEEALNKFIPTDEKADAVVVGFFDKDSKAEKFYEEFAKKFRDDFQFGVVTSSAVTSAKGEKANTIVLFKAYDDKKAVFDGENTDDELSNFLKTNKFRLVDQIGPENYRSYVERKFPIAWMFVDPAETDKTDAALEQYKAVAPKFRSISFVWLSGKQYGQMVTKMALSGKVLPAVAIETPNGEHFPFDEESELSAANMEKFFSDYTGGKLTAKIRSDPVPENPIEEDGVYVLVGSTFEQIVMDTNKDVLVEFYAPWCGHCKKLTPIYGELATELKGNDKIVIAKMDATTNDAPGQFEVQGFPTIKLVKAGDNSVVDFNGDRTKEGFLKFLKQTATHGSSIKGGDHDEL